MLRKPILYIILTLALATMACGLSINLPIQDVKTGSLQTDEINVPAPQAEVIDLTLAFGGGEMTLQPGDDTYLLSGTAIYNVPDFKPELSTEGNSVRLESGNLEVNGIPKFDDDIRNEWNFRLGTQPLDLHINAGAYQADIDLGGLSIRSLQVTDGASDVNLRFTAPNQQEMDTLSYETGASDVTLSELGNANFNYMTFRGGAGSYTLDFSGELRRDAIVRIESGISRVTIIIPKGLAAVVNTSGGLSNVDTDGDWSKSGNQYRVEGGERILTFDVTMSAGTLELQVK